MRAKSDSEVFKRTVSEGERAEFLRRIQNETEEFIQSPRSCRTRNALANGSTTNSEGNVEDTVNESSSENNDVVRIVNETDIAQLKNVCYFCQYTMEFPSVRMSCQCIFHYDCLILHIRHCIGDSSTVQCPFSNDTSNPCQDSDFFITPQFCRVLNGICGGYTPKQQLFIEEGEITEREFEIFHERLKPKPVPAPGPGPEDEEVKAFEEFQKVSGKACPGCNVFSSHFNGGIIISLRISILP